MILGTLRDGYEKLKGNGLLSFGAGGFIFGKEVFRVFLVSNNNYFPVEFLR